MHHILRGALGAALVYPLVWYYHSQPVPQSLPAPADTPRVASGRAPGKVQSSAPAQEAPAPEQMAAPAPARAREVAPSEVRPEQLARSVRQQLPQLAPELMKPVEPELPGLPRVDEPKVPFPAFEEIRDALGQLRDFQEDAHDPKALEKRVQAMEDDPQKLARLRALAEQFVELPPPRGDRYLPARDTSRSTPSR